MGSVRVERCRNCGTALPAPAEGRPRNFGFCGARKSGSTLHVLDAQTGAPRFKIGCED